MKGITDAADAKIRPKATIRDRVEWVLGSRPKPRKHVCSMGWTWTHQHRMASTRTHSMRTCLSEKIHINEARRDGSDLVDPAYRMMEWEAKPELLGVKPSSHGPAKTSSTTNLSQCTLVRRDLCYQEQNPALLNLALAVSVNERSFEWVAPVAVVIDCRERLSLVPE